ncbi:tetratricopeptide repeat protein [Parapedobacter sp. ISTM3]|uniref:Tetratricopeptide repeat-containing protein n=1 Tax=Parapedobacter luteus TaxID=623280 RepID=A0A1T5A1C0_9SPHI|nr:MULTISPECIES: tetratricopeptide repeat protein [Parapedobacter]MBK1440035.1 tetratricopeptide repeat protein [Parapedobacter sp. ISTM3]SKB28792.1 Tetratricopeptide repeat-containing protein [Parapedobacter luteus]
MSSNQKHKTVETAPTKKTGSFILENQKSLVFIIGGIVVLVLLYIGYQRFYLAPRAETAADQLFKAEGYATIDSLQQRAIDGDGSYPGFKEIADEYENTKSANIANAYLGGLYLRQGNYQEAISALEKYSNTGSTILDPLVIGMLGDAYSELKDYKKAASYYKKAAEKNSNLFTSPLLLKKLGLVYEAQNDFKQAVDAYKRIQSDYPESQEATAVEGYIARAEAQL